MDIWSEGVDRPVTCDCGSGISTDSDNAASKVPRTAEQIIKTRNGGNEDANNNVSNFQRGLKEAVCLYEILCVWDESSLSKFERVYF